MQAIDPKPGDHIVEVGPGFGVLTQHLLPMVTRLDAIELDRDLIPELKTNCKNLGELHVHCCDILRFDFAKLGHDAANLRLVGNLPYNISTPLLFYTIKNINKIKDMHFMLQEEVAKRLVAVPGNKIYGRLSVMLQYFFRIEILFGIGPESFWPAPEVYSSFVRFIPREQKEIIAANVTTLTDVVRTAFNQRRKTVRNCFKLLLSEQDFVNLDINPLARPEELSPVDFVRIANYIYKQAGPAQHIAQITENAQL